MKTNWEQVGLGEVEGLVGCWVWATDGVCGYARRMAEGETMSEAAANFEAAGESAVEIRVYHDGEWVE